MNSFIFIYLAVNKHLTKDNVGSKYTVDKNEYYVMPNATSYSSMG